MKILVVNDYNEMSRKAANIVASQIILKPNSVIGLAKVILQRECIKSL